MTMMLHNAALYLDAAKANTRAALSTTTTTPHYPWYQTNKPRDAHPTQTNCPLHQITRHHSSPRHLINKTFNIRNHHGNFLREIQKVAPELTIIPNNLTHALYHYILKMPTN
jgi:hypothetical protein